MAQDTEGLGEGTLQFEDSLLGCLVMLTKLHQEPYSPATLTVGLPLVGGKLTPQLFTRAAERAGYTAKVVKRSLARIPHLVLPVVLILNDNQACLLTKLSEDGTAEVIYPETGLSTKKVSLEVLEKDYTGYAIFLQKQVTLEKRSDETDVEKLGGSWFWGTMFRYRKIFYRVMLAAFLINLFALAIPIFIMLVYNNVIPNNTFSTLWVLVIGVAIILLFDFVMKILRGHFIDMASKKTDMQLASALFHKVLSVHMASKPASSGAFANELVEFEAVREFFTSATLVCFVDLPFIFIFIFVMYIIGGPLAYIPLIVIPIVVILSVLMEIPMRNASRTAYVGSKQKHAVLIESIAGIETLKSMVAEGAMQRRWEKSIGITYRASQTSRFHGLLAISITSLLQQFITVGIMLFGVYLVYAGSITVGALIACSLIAGRALAPIGQLSSIFIKLQQTRMSLKGLDRLMDLPSERVASKQYISHPTLKGDIEFENVTFAYPMSEYPALNNVSFKIKAGEKVALIGSSGSGKTTIQRLLLGLYKPQKGNIRLDGTDIQQIDPADIRRNVGSFLQDFILFYGSLRDNIALKYPWADDQEILEAARISCVDDFAKLHHEGYHMLVEERGGSLSGGQRQCVMLARAYLGNPPILLLDEPTGSMDFNTERKIINNLHEFTKDKTLLITSHRMSLLSLVDTLIVIDQGTVVAQGPRDVILERLKANTAGTSNG